MNIEDIGELTTVWDRETESALNGFCEAVKRAQDHAYALGFKRGREGHTELVAALEDLVSRCVVTYGTDAHYTANARAALAISNRITLE